MEELDTTEIDAVYGAGPWLVGAAIWGAISAVAGGYDAAKSFCKGFDTGFKEEVATRKK